MRKTWIFGIVFLFCIMSVMALDAPSITLLNQTPTDITTQNIKNSPLIIYAQIQDTGNNLDTSTVKIYFKSNTSTSDISHYTNGVAYTGWNNTRLYDSNTTDVFKFIGYENAVYSGIYNFAWLSFRYDTHSSALIDNTAKWLKVEILNVSTTKGENYLAYMVNTTIEGTQSSVYYCNNSYTTGNPTTSANCVYLYVSPSNTYDHCHPGLKSCHHIAPFPIVSGRVGLIDITSTSYFLFRGINNAQFWYIPNSSRTGATSTSTNTGTTWTSQSYTADVNLKQFDGSDRVTYKICASDGVNETCTTEVSQTLTTGDMATLPTIPTVYTPEYETGVCPTDTLQSTIMFCFLGLLLVVGFWYSDTKNFGLGLIAVGVLTIFYSLPLYGCSFAWGLVLTFIGVMVGIYAWKLKYY
jgi:hypothetical protein